MEKTIYVLTGTDMAFASWELAEKFMNYANNHPEKYSHVYNDDFRKFILMEDDKTW